MGWELGRRGTHGGNGGAAGDAEALPQTPQKGPVPLESLTSRGTVVRVEVMVARPWGIPGAEGPPGCVLIGGTGALFPCGKGA